VRPYYQAGGVTIYHADCFDVLPELAGSGFHLCVTDPPFGDTNLDWDVRAPRWLDSVGPVLLPAASVWFFTSLRYLLAAWPAFKGWSLAQEVVWEKHNGTNLRRDRFRRVHELAVQIYRGPWSAVWSVPPRVYQARARVVRRQSRPAQWLGARGAVRFVQPAGVTKLQRSVIRARSLHRRGHHPTQKPLSVVRPLVECSCPPGGTVLDPFMGSGTTLVAALVSRRSAVGIERDERYCEVAARRCSQGNLELAGEGGCDGSGAGR